jgi:hypothetical protein
MRNTANRKIYIAFSQNVSFVDKTKIYITYDNITLRGDDTRLDGEYFDPIFGLSSTYVLTIKNTVEGLALNSSLQNSTNKKIRLDKGSFTNSGNSVNSSDTLTKNALRDRSRCRHPQMSPNTSYGRSTSSPTLTTPPEECGSTPDTS